MDKLKDKFNMNKLIRTILVFIMLISISTISFADVGGFERYDSGGSDWGSSWSSSSSSWDSDWGSSSYDDGYGSLIFLGGRWMGNYNNPYNYNSLFYI